MVQEISELRRNEEETGRLRLLARDSELIARMGAITGLIVHDIRQPLAAILSNAQAALRILEKGQHDPGEIREILEDIILDEKRASAIISEINNRLHHREAVRKEIRLSNSVQDALDLLHEEIMGHGIQIQFVRDQDCVVLADEVQIRQVLVDLITNSIEAMRNQPAHQRRLEVTLTLASPEMAQITVSDSGLGIPDADAGRVFDPFWTKKDQGLGVGLYICRSIIQSHGGGIQHRNNQGSGTVFCFTLPLAAATGPGKQASGPSLAESGFAPESPGGGLARLRILLVDDSESYRRTTWSILQNLPSLQLAGEAVDGLEAVRKAEELKPDLILMDISLAGINGIEAASRIRTVAPNSKILFLSQYEDPDIVRAVLHTGALGYVLKVDSGKDLLAALAAVSRGKTFISRK